MCGEGEKRLLDFNVHSHLRKMKLKKKERKGAEDKRTSGYSHLPAAK